MPKIPFGEWLPDLPPIGLQGATKCSNVIPDSQSYRPFPALSVFSTAVGGRVKGGVVANDNARNNYNYVGDSSALYSLVQASFTNVSRLVGGTYTLGTDDFWEFANWGNTVIGVNGLTDNPQLISLGGANFADLSISIKARHIGTMRDFVILGNISDSATNIYRVRWCAINNPLSWTADAATLADFQDLPSDGGQVQKVLGGETTFVMQERSIWRMQFVGSPLIFQFDPVHKQIGAYVPQACIRYQNQVFFLAEDGFYSFNGTELKSIGRGKVDSFFFHDISTTNYLRTHVSLDQKNKLVMWAYPSAGGTVGGNPDKLLCYSWAYDRWVLVEGLNIEYLLQGVVTGYTLEGLDAISTNIDALPVSLDSDQWTGGQIILSAFDSSHRLSRFNGSAMAATVDTGEFQLFEGSRAMITEIRPDLVGLNTSLNITVLNRNLLTGSVSTGATTLIPNATGFCECRVSARYYRIRMNTTAGSDFTHLIGVEVDGVQGGHR